jgi:hypothetical protein
MAFLNIITTIWPNGVLSAFWACPLSKHNAQLSGEFAAHKQEVGYKIGNWHFQWRG